MSVVSRVRTPLLAAAVAVGALAAAALPAATVSASPGYDCPGGMFCGWDGPDGTGPMIVQVESICALHDIGNGGVGDRLTSYWNRTGKTVGIYNWTGEEWQLLASTADNTRGTLPAWADNIADAVWVCG
ncbi:peptidase inhibitor family I36 protein [Nocardia sp. NPDC003482]